MNSKKNKKNNLIYTYSIVAILLCIICMSVGYSALNINLTISGRASVLGEEKIDITNVVVKELTDGVNNSYSFNSNSTNISVNLPSVDSTATFLIEVFNGSNNYYHLDLIEELFVSDNDNIGYEIVDKESLYFLENSINQIEIKFFYKTDTVSNPDFSVNLKYSFNLVDYRKLDYLVSTGTQWIDTGLVNTGDYIFETEVRQHLHTSNDGGWIISGRISSSYTLGLFFGKYGLYNGYGGGTSPQQPTPVLNTWYSIYFSRFELRLNDINYNVSGKVLVPEENLINIRLGGATTGWNGGVDLRHFAGDIKYLKVKDAKSLNYLRYFIPVKMNETGEIGYWDEIAGIFYSNDGTGEFGE